MDKIAMNLTPLCNFTQQQGQTILVKETIQKTYTKWLILFVGGLTWIRNGGITYGEILKSYRCRTNAGAMTIGTS